MEVKIESGMSKKYSKTQTILLLLKSTVKKSKKKRTVSTSRDTLGLKCIFIIQKVISIELFNTINPSQKHGASPVNYIERIAIKYRFPKYLIISIFIIACIFHFHCVLIKEKLSVAPL